VPIGVLLPPRRKERESPLSLEKDKRGGVTARHRKRGELKSGLFVASSVRDLGEKALPELGSLRSQQVISRQVI